MSAGSEPSPTPGPWLSAEPEARFRALFRRVHAGHAVCADDEWLREPCREPGGELANRPIAWSRRNGPWRRVETLWVGAAPGNAGGRGGGSMGAHATRIPFGGDVAGANLDVLLGAAGLDRNQVFITAALNHLPAAGGGEPKPAELRASVGTVPSSIHLLRETVLASGAALVLALGNVAHRATVAAGLLNGAERVRLPGKARLEALGFAREHVADWSRTAPPDPAFTAAWRAAWGQAALPAILWLTHPSAQNMSPWAGRETLFHVRMVEARDAVRGAVRKVLGREPPAERSPLPTTGIYALPEWRTQVGPRHAELDARWRDHGV